MKNKIYIIQENDEWIELLRKELNNISAPYLGAKTKHKPLLQYLLPVGFGPSSKICP